MAQNRSCHSLYALKGGCAIDGYVRLLYWERIAVSLLAGGRFLILNRDAQNLAGRISRIMPLMTAADFCDRNAREFGAREALVDGRHRLTWSQVKQLSDR